MCKDKSFPNIILYGPKGTGKKTIINLLLEILYGSSSKKLKSIKYSISGSGNKIKDVIIKQSDNHIVIEPGNNNFDRYLIQDIVKEYAKKNQINFFTDNHIFKSVLINNIDNLSYFAQTSLRRTMEKYSKNCRFIMWCHSLSSVIDPLKSRCICINVASPTYDELFKYIVSINIKENIKYENKKIPHKYISMNKIDDIIKSSNGNIKKALWNLQYYRAGYLPENDFDKIINKIFLLILDKKIDNINDIRILIYDILITGFDPIQIISKITELFIINKNKISSDKLIKIFELSSKISQNVIRGRRSIIHIETFIISLMNTLL